MESKSRSAAADTAASSASSTPAASVFENMFEVYRGGPTSTGAVPTMSPDVSQHPFIPLTRSRLPTEEPLPWSGSPHPATGWAGWSSSAVSPRSTRGVRRRGAAVPGADRRARHAAGTAIPARRAVPAGAEPVPPALLGPVLRRVRLVRAALCGGPGGRRRGRLPLWARACVWALLWALYLSIVNVGQTWYGFGWESLLLEVGFLAIFLGTTTSRRRSWCCGCCAGCCSGSSSAPG